MRLIVRERVRAWATVIAVACILALLALAHVTSAQEPEGPDYCSWTKEVWVNDTGPYYVAVSKTLGVVVSDTIRVRDRLFCDFQYEWTLDESWDPDLLSLSGDPQSGDGEVDWGAGWLQWWGDEDTTSVTLNKCLHVDETGWVTTKVTETADFDKEGAPFQSFEKPLYLEQLLDGGDAPSSHHHSTGVTMTTYPAGLQANFPVVWDWDGTLGAGAGGGAYPSGYYGFCHYASIQPSFLGITVTHELDADLLPDRDGLTNIDPPSDTPNRDGADHGVTFPSTLPHCGSATVNVVGQNSFGGNLYINAWVDWNRDGDWEDASVCACGDNEWAIQGYSVSPGSFNVSIPITPCHPVADPTEPLWLRVTLSELDPLPAAPWTYGGQPHAAPSGCFEEGETEDHYVVPELTPECRWEKEVYINGSSAGEWDEGPFYMVVTDTITMSDTLSCNFEYDWGLLEEWDSGHLSLVSYDFSHGQVLTDTGQVAWGGGEPDKIPPGTAVTLTKTLRVDLPAWADTVITETVTFSPEGKVDPIERSVDVVELLEGGDAPSGHYHGGPPPPMQTYPGSGVWAQYPVVWDWDGSLGAGPFTGYYGFCHYSPGASFLGTQPTWELDADLLPDQDLVTNIDPPTDTPGRDGSNDGATFPAGLPHRRPATLNIVGQNSYTDTLFINAWADWNRDGDWEDGSVCGSGDDEWAIKDYGVAPGAINESIVITPCHPCDPTEPLWVRVTLGEMQLGPLAQPWIYGGQPHAAPFGCFSQGETEDYLFRQHLSYTPLVLKRH